ncbi:MAG: DUF5004 domain-containing protein [Saprospiraceae bacterium]|nr:DUF5004 domain-containing protein [Saprospiraceae bacterium]
MLLSCEDDISIPDGALQEQIVDLQGSWKVQQVILNGQDVTPLFDFGDIKLTLQMDQGPSDFQIETGDAPFPILTSGTWKYDDPVYPQSISFLSAQNERSVLLAEAPISGNTTFKISFSLGCEDNTYTYIFEKE